MKYATDQVLLDVVEADATVTGAAQKVFYITDRYLLRATVTEDGGSSPTCNIKLQHSPTAETGTWTDVESLAEITTATAAVSEAHITSVNTALLPYVRAVATLGGTSLDYDILIEFFAY